MAGEGFVAFESVNVLVGAKRWPVWRIIRLSDYAMFDAPRPADAWLGNSAALTDTEFFVAETDYGSEQIHAVMRYDLSQIDTWGVPPAQ